MAKLSTLKLTDRAEQGAACVIRDYTADKAGKDGALPPLLAGDGSPITITLLGIDSAAAQRIRRERAAAQQSQLYTSLYAKQEDEKPDGLVSPDDIAAQEEAEIAMLAALTVTWHGFEDDDDAPVPCTHDAAEALYRACPPIRAQVSAFVNDRARFFGPLATPSARTSPTTSA